MTARTIPIINPTIQMSAPSPGDPMEITTPTDSSPPPLTASSVKSPDRDTLTASTRSVSVTIPTTAVAAANKNGTSPIVPTISMSGPPEPAPKTESQQSQSLSAASSGSSAPTAAAPAVHQPKIVQTAFIHKLYNMLEDPNIQHLISWSDSAESFVMSPSHDFSKVLAQYFKHTNISSFVRQLNMYGFHKVSDVFANGSDSTTLWEFKHGNGNFKKGDVLGLREIKRRASRHSLVHREYSSQKPPPPPTQAGTPTETMPIPEGGDMRMNFDQAMFNFDARLQRNEEAMHYMHIKHQAAMDMIARLLHFNQELSRNLLNMVPSMDNPIHRDVIALQGEMQRQAEMLRSLDESHEPPLFSGTRQFFAGVENAPVSPRQMPQDDPRRSTLTVPQSRTAGNFYRPPVPSNLSISTRRPYGSIGGGTTVVPSTSPSRSQLPPPPPVPSHNLTPMEPPANNMGRRHTSADIRAHGWQTSAPPHLSPLGPGPGSVPVPVPSQYPTSPNRLPEDQRIRESFSAYSLQAASQPHSRPETPPPPPPFLGANANTNGNGNGAGPDLGNWSWGSAVSRNSSLNVKNSSAPPTRRGSMAHILNPTDTAERADEDASPRDEDRKRKRMV